jgi:hypothetical protein
VLASIVEVDAGACYEIIHRARNEDLARLSQCSESRSDMNGEARELVSVTLTLAGVQTCSDLKGLEGGLF